MLSGPIFIEPIQTSDSTQPAKRLRLGVLDKLSFWSATRASREHWAEVFGLLKVHQQLVLGL
jgi:hypothetical protein